MNLGPGLQRIDFFNYGESFIHPRAIEMIEYAKSRYPQIYLFTSTNGLLLNTDEKLRALLRNQELMKLLSRSMAQCRIHMCVIAAEVISIN